MKIVYVDGPQPDTVEHPSIFLAGPTPRSSDDKSWRPEALELLSKHDGCLNGTDLTVFVPERSDAHTEIEYYDQVEWEWRNLNHCTVVLFWVPRKLPEFPAFTTNIEFGRYVSLRTADCVYGRPETSEKNKYLDWLYTKLTGLQPLDNLALAISASVELVCTSLLAKKQS